MPSSGSVWSELADAGVDLFLGGRCAGCGREGRVLCRACEAALPQEGRPAWPDPVPPGLAPPWAAGEYDGLLRALVLSHKERGVLGLRRPLAVALATAVTAALGPRDLGAVVLVPVPSRPGTTRSRGHDPTGRITAGAARLLRARGYDVLARPLLRTRAGVLDQAGLDATERAANLAGSMHCPTELVRRLAARRTHAHVVVCDDVLTTGSTAREAQRALAAIGLETAAIAAVAATRRRRPGTSDPFVVTPDGLTS